MPLMITNVDGTIDKIIKNENCLKCKKEYELILNNGKISPIEYIRICLGQEYLGFCSPKCMAEWKEEDAPDKIRMMMTKEFIQSNLKTIEQNKSDKKVIAFRKFIEEKKKHDGRR